MSETGGEADLVLTSVGGLSLLLTHFSNQESGHCTSPGQQLALMVQVWSDLEVMKTGELGPPLAHCCKK